MIDAHCHIDLYPNPEEILSYCNSKDITVIAMTNLPSHFEMGFQHIREYKRIRMALGMHPLYASEHEREYQKFIDNFDKTSYIGEIGLDYSNEGYHTKTIQMQSFRKILQLVCDKPKILSIHSRRAEEEVFNELIFHNIKAAIFHWYSGSISLIEDIAKAGYFFSINPAMVQSPNGQKIIAKIPAASILTESDGPFIEYKKQTVMPGDVIIVEEYLAKTHQKTRQVISEQIRSNFKSIVSLIKV
ncbi:Qat anti-phage system TatD family nuclease QatD [Pedobacter africanus]|uniref:TatD DNase family protein n=1 Tax=Pedobacter africanus TaxID=151894 RepID=A0A1W2CS51_9SPHI|nr:Qat anti-phage system TatD family nuclease QatD [Pedobacter africanus]SMC87786.1 TatD DNase family protein [Pedobacter africanus]